jgi:hypothetical protein
VTAKERRHSWYLKNKDRVKDNTRRWQNANRDHINERRRALRKNNPESHRLEKERERKYRRSLSPEKIKEKQLRKTLRECPESDTVCSVKFDTDHDHKRLTFRGILGSTCNKTLGLVKDNPARLRLLAKYLEVA